MNPRPGQMHGFAVASSSLPTTRYSTLDALRGIAAISVVFFHAAELSPISLPSAYLAVDLFFAISGFILADIYGPRLGNGLFSLTFMKIRFLRLYPLYLIGSVLGLTVLAASALRKGETFAGTIPFTLMFLPTPGAADDFLYPANHPAWSLFYEMIVNFVFAIGLWRLPVAGLTIIAALACAEFVTIAADGRVNAGSVVGDFSIGLVRATYGFCAGMLVHRVNQTIGSMQILQWPGAGWVVMLVTVAIFAVPMGSELATAAMILMPLLVLFASKANVGNRSLAENLGSMSYALYCIHAPILTVAWFVAKHTSAPVAVMSAGIAASLIAAWSLDRHYDGPARQLLNRLLGA